MYSLSSLLPERHSHMLQQRHALGIGLGSGCNRNIHSLGFLYFSVVDRVESDDSAAHELGFLSGFAETVHYGTLLDLGHTHDVLVAEFLHQCMDDAILINVAESSIHLLGFFGSFWLFIRLRFLRGGAL